MDELDLNKLNVIHYYKGLKFNDQSKVSHYDQSK